MREIVMNETDYINKLKDKGNLGKDVGYAVGLLAKYYRSKGDDVKAIKQKLKADLQKYEPLLKNKQRDTYIDNAIKSVDKRLLNNINEIPVTQKEIDVIMGIAACSNGFKPASMRRLAFALLCFAKFELARGKSEAWINCDLRLIYKAAGLAGFSNSRCNLCLHELYKKGLVQLGSGVGNLSVKVTFADNSENSKPVIRVRDINYAKDYFKQYMGANYINCRNCGRLIYKSNNRIMYCPDCRVIINREKTLQRIMKLNQKNHIF